jgi:hypothetical protein
MRRRLRKRGYISVYQTISCGSRLTDDQGFLLQFSLRFNRHCEGSRKGVLKALRTTGCEDRRYWSLEKGNLSKSSGNTDEHRLVVSLNTLLWCWYIKIVLVAVGLGNRKGWILISSCMTSEPALSGAVK